jgi:uncharacterized protein YgiM (DUF1202 family)
MNSAKRILSLMLVLVCVLACVPTATAVQEADAHASYPAPGTGSVDLPDELFLTQDGSGTCTLCSATMMIRHALYINHNHNWSSAKESAVRPYGWYNGVGLKWDFTYVIDGTSIKVGHQGVNGFSVQSLKKVLDEHPEGIVLYCGNLPHAVFLFDYEGDTFYCAETVKGYSGKRIKLEDSWLGYRYGSLSWLLANVTSYWYIKDYSDETGSRECDCTALYAGTYVCTTSSSGLLIRNGHGTDSDVLGLIPSGEKVTVHRTSGKGYNDWAHVSYNGINGYCSVRYLEMVEPKHDFETTVVEPDCHNGGYTTYTCSGCGIKITADPVDALGHTYGAWTNSDYPGEQIRKCIRCDATETRTVETGLMGTITGSQLRIRSGAGTGYGVVGFLDKGDRVEILEIKDVGSEVWGRISQGWISMRYVKLDDPAGEEPPVTEPPVTEPPVTEPPVTEPPVVETGRLGTVTASCLCVRSGAGTGNSVVGYLYYGARVEILEQKTVGGMTWGRTAQGWISMSYVELDPVEDTPAQPRMVMVNTGCLRIRAEATTNSEIVGYLYWGAQVEILETKDVDGMTWGRTSQGWISMDYVEEI